MLPNCQPESPIQAVKKIVSVSVNHPNDKGFNREDHKRPECGNGAEFIPSKEKNPSPHNVSSIEFIGKLTSYHDPPSMHLDWLWLP